MCHQRRIIYYIYGMYKPRRPVSIARPPGGRRQTWEDEKDDYAEERQFISNAKIVVATACRPSHWQ